MLHGIHLWTKSVQCPSRDFITVYQSKYLRFRYTSKIICNQNAIIFATISLAIIKTRHLQLWEERFNSDGLLPQIIEHTKDHDVEIDLLWGCSIRVFNATFNSISVISWCAVLLVAETGIHNIKNCRSLIKYLYHHKYVKDMLVFQIFKHHSPSSQWFGTDMVNSIYLLLKFTVPK